MKQEDKIKEESEQGKKWMTIQVSHQELTEILNVKNQWESMGLTLPYTKILRQIVSKGFQLIDWEQVQKNPLALFQESNA